MTVSLAQLRSDVRYELPPGGTTLLGYVVRRMHKTALLQPVPDLLLQGRPAEALAQVALYAAASAASYGPALYQPRFNAVGTSVAEADPRTGAQVSARLEADSPHYVISYRVELPEGGLFTGREEITGTTVGLGGLGMPAPSRFSFELPSQGYSAELGGLITSELAPTFFGPWRIRAHGELSLKDSLGGSGRLRLQRSGEMRLEISGPDGARLERRAHLAAG